MKKLNVLKWTKCVPHPAHHTAKLWAGSFSLLSLSLILTLLFAGALPAGADLVGFWNFDNDDLVESSGNNIPGTYDGETGTGSVAYADGPLGFGRALDLSGGDNAVQAKNSGWADPTFHFGHGTAFSMTVATWVKGWPDADADNFVAMAPLDQGNHGYSLRRGDADEAEFTYGGQVIKGNAGVDLTDGDWHHLAGVVDTNLTGTSQVKLYVDGLLAVSNSIGAKWDNDPEHLVFGAKEIGTTFSQFSSLQLDEIRIYDAPLSQAEIAELTDPGPAWASPGVSNIAPTSADAFATLVIQGVATNATSWLYWDTTDKGENFTWGNTNSLGTVSTGLVESTISGLTHATTYYARFYGTNSTINADGWSASISFTTVTLIANSPATDVFSTSATFNATLHSPSTNYDVIVYWGTNDGGAAEGSWGNTNYVASYTNVATANPTLAAGSLSADTEYHYAFRATNANDSFWATPSITFSTVSQPAINNGVGAAPAFGYATLNGNLASGTLADVYLYWGTSDEGTNSFAWANTNSLGTVPEGAFSTNATALLYGETYYYRCYATNAVGEDWADSTESFTTLPPETANFSTDGLLGMWTFDDDNANDSSGNDYHGTESAAVVYSTDTPGGTGKSVDLNGDEYIYVDTGGNQDVFDLDAMSISFWGKEWPDGGWEPYISKKGEGQGWQVRKNNNNASLMAFTLRGPGNDDWGATVSGDLNQWHHYVATYGDGKRRLYQDGSMIGEENRSGNVNDTTDMLVFGARDNASIGWYANVWLDDIFIYNRAINATEVSNLYSSAGLLFAGPNIQNGAQTEITTTSATFNAVLEAPGSVFDVYLYWGVSDGGAAEGAWGNTNFVGSYTDETSINLEFAVATLSQSTEYHYTFGAQNDATNIWASPSVTFTTVGQPGINNGTGAMPAVGYATLNGNLTNGSLAYITVYWGTIDGGTNATSWANTNSLGELPEGAFSTSTTTDLLYGVTYFYRCYATNAVGDDWADSTENFMTEAPFWVPSGNSSVLWDFYPDPGDFNGWTLVNGDVAYRAGDNGGLVPGNGAGGEGGDNNQVANLLMESPVIGFDQGAAGTVFTWAGAGGGSGEGAFANPTAVINWNNGVPANGGEKCVAFLNLDTGNYDAILPKSGNGFGTLTYSLAELGGEGLDTTKRYRVHYYENDQGGWGWGQLNYIDLVGDIYNVGLSITNTPVTDLTTTSATFNATFNPTGSVFDVYVYWGTNDGGAAEGGWGNTNYIGSYTNGSSTNLAFATYTLVQGQEYNYRFMAQNDATNLWGSPTITFSTLYQPIVDNGTGATPQIGYAALNGELTAGSRANITVYWGTSDEGTNAANWAHTNTLGELAEGTFATNTTALLYGLTYYYRCYATNAVGEDWADSTTNFTTLFPGPVYTNALNLYGYHINNDALAMDLHNNGGMMGGGDPTTFQDFYGQALLTTGPGNRGLDFNNDGDFQSLGVIGQNDNYSTLFVGYLHAVANGDYQFQRENDDDAMGFWLDLDQDGVFESTTPGLGSDRGEQLQWDQDGGVKTATLTEGDYLFAATHREGTGGSGIDINFKAPTMGGFATIQPATDPAQEGMWIILTGSNRVSIANQDVSGLTTTSATFNATLRGTQSVFDVYLYWGTSDGGAAEGSWGNTNHIGSYTNVASTNLDYAAGGLVLGEEYHYTFLAQNQLTNLWVSPSITFRTVHQPDVNNSTGAVAGIGSATLYGELTAGSEADITVYWGATDAGTNHTDWANTNVVGTSREVTFSTGTSSSLLFGVTYYYRCYASNDAGDAWADSSTSFTVLPLQGAVPGMVGHWPFDNSSDVGKANVSDDLETVAQATHSPTAQIGAGSLILDGNGDYLRVDGSHTLATGMPTGGNAYTLSAWIRPTGTGSRGIISWGNFGSGSQVNAFRQDGANNLHNYWWGNDLNASAAPSDLDDGNWHHVLAVYEATGSGNDHFIYVDGAVKNQRNGSGLNCGAVNFRIGSSNNGEWFLGRIDDVAVWNRALSLDEITTLYNAGLAGQNAEAAFVDAEIFLTNAPASSITETSATFNAVLGATQAIFDVYVYWGDSDGGAAEESWGNTNYIGSYTNVAATNLSFATGGLVQDTEYHYAFLAQNPATNMWAAPSMTFTTDTVIANSPASDLSSTSAVLNAVLYAAGSTNEVYVFWGDSDGGTSEGSWANTNYVGSYTNVASTNLSFAIGGLTNSTPYYYTFRATEGSYTAWAHPSAGFYTFGAPAVQTLAAVPGMGYASLRGELLSAGGAPTTVHVYWGDSDGGTNIADWANTNIVASPVEGVPFSTSTTSNLLFGQQYYFRCYATNSNGVAWADATAGFLTLVPEGGPDAPEGAIGYWSFDNAADVGHDDSENGNDGTQIGNAQYDSNGIFEGALFLDGTGDWLNCGNGIAINNRDFSLSFWTRRDGTGEDYVIGHSAGGNNNALHVGFRDPDTFTFAFWSNDLNYDDAGNVGDTANYHHWVCTYDATIKQQLLYLDGNTTPVDNEVRTVDFGGTDDFYIGCRRNGEGRYEGLIDEVYVYERVLTGTEAAQLYAAPESLALGVGIANEPATESYPDYTMNATLNATQAVFDVYVYWGTSDEGDAETAWANTNYVGSYTNTSGVAVAFTRSDLALSTTYHYRYMAQNPATNMWASPSESFTTIGPEHILPFVETFENRTLGDLDGQYGWVASNIEVQGTTTHLGSSKAGCTTTNGISEMSHTFVDGQADVWTDFYAKPDFGDPAGAGTLTENTTAAFLVGTNGQVIAYDGTNKTELVHTPLVDGDDWIRFTIHNDYIDQEWDLYLNGQPIGIGLDFYTNTASYTKFGLRNSGTNNVYIDDINIQLTPPSFAGGTLILVR
jgi:hypothetical protein